METQRKWEDNIRRVKPYLPGEQPQMAQMIKLNTNENPYPPAPAVKEAIRAFDGNRLSLYPDPEARALTAALEEYYRLEKGQVFVGVGSDDVLAMSFLTFFNSKRPVLFSQITYSFYEVWAGLFGIPFQTLALDESFHLRREDYYRENGGIVLANPNAPTSIDEGLPVIRDILKHNQDVIVIVDEAYVDFGAESAISLLPEFENLLVVQTFSKSRSMAGMRIGYAMGSPALIQALNNVKNSYNSYPMNMVSVAAGAASLKEKDYFKDNLDKIISSRERAKAELAKLDFTFPDSRTNFIFAAHKTIPAKELFEALRRKNIFVRYFDLPGINHYMRITIGSDEEMDALLGELGAYIRDRERTGGNSCWRKN